MMLSVLVWLAMWGQGQTPDLSELTDPGIVRPLKTGPHVPWDEDPSMLGDSHAPSKPAEHIIEIKTVRQYDEKCIEQWNLMHCDTTGCEVHGWDDDMKHCVRVTRELWIDGTKFGVIKGLE